MLLEVLAPDRVPSAVRAWLPEQLELLPAPQGETSEVAFVRDEPLVIKRARGPVFTSWLEMEHRALVALADSGLPMPTALGFHWEPGPDGGEAWLVMSRLPGIPLVERLARVETLTEREAWYHRLGVLTARIHMQPIPSELRPDDPRRWLERVLERARKAPGRWVQRIAARFGPDRPPDVPETLIHGDLTIDNVLADGDELSGLIDWGGAGPGDPRYDITLATSTAEGLLEPSVSAAFFEGYASQPLPQSHRAFLDHFYPRAPEA